jgi:ABC-type sulfate/molybdate transport systems ATPase subunit
MVLLDEPFSSLDRNIRVKARAKVREVRKTHDVPLVLVTHDVADAIALGDHAAVFHEGRTVREGPISALFLDGHLSEHGLPGRILSIRVEDEAATVVVQLGEGLLPVPMSLEHLVGAGFEEDQEVVVILGAHGPQIRRRGTITLAEKTLR